MDLNIPSDSYNEGEKSIDFISNIKIQFDRYGNQSTNNGELKKYILTNHREIILNKNPSSREMLIP